MALDLDSSKIIQSRYLNFIPGENLIKDIYKNGVNEKYNNNYEKAI